ncbi:MAG TPA: SPOR domain-containing protein [Vicinamibacterales bacterium]
MNDLADDGFHEIQLSGKQLVFLFMATTIVAVVIFLCGVQVGRGVRSDRAIDGGDSSASAAPPPAAATPSQPAAAGGPPAAEPPAPAPEPDDELSYAKRLQGDQSASAEKLKGAPPPSVAALKPTASARGSAAPPSPASQPSPKPSAATQGPRTDAPAAQSGGRPGGWIVQLMALKDRSECVNLAQRLVSKGYPAFVLDPAPGSPAIYRVQVGGYPDRDKADQAARRLEKEEQYKTYVRSR